MSILILAIIAWYVTEGSNLIQIAKWFFKIKRLYILDCPKCLGFWLGLFVNLRIATMQIDFGFDIIQAVLVSTTAILISKIYNRL